jgi:hypothetical protein
MKSKHVGSLEVEFYVVSYYNIEKYCEIFS